MSMLQVVLRERFPCNDNYYDGWYIDEETKEPRMYTVYADPTQAKVLKMNGFDIVWGDNPPPDCIKQKLLRDYQPVPVKVVVLS